MNMTKEVIEIIEKDIGDIEDLARIHRTILKARGLPYAGAEDQYKTVMTSIASGRMDDGLDSIEQAIASRRANLPCVFCGMTGAHEPSCANWTMGDGPDDREKRDPSDFKVGDTIEVIGKLRPNYLFGHCFNVVKINDKTVVIDVPDEPKYRRFAGHRGVRIPKNAVKVVSQ